MILLVMFICGSVCFLFLPETLYQTLPQTVEETRTFGVDQAFWHWPRRPKQDDLDADEKKNDSIKK